MSKETFVYRAKGTYRPTGKDTWITRSWTKDINDATSDIKAYGQNFDNARIEKLDYVLFANRHKHYPKIRW